MRGHVLYASAVGMASGVVTRSFFVVAPEVFIIFGTGVALAVLVGFRARISRTILWSVVGFTLCFGIGVWRFADVSQSYDAVITELTPFESQEVVFEGVIVRDVERRDTGSVMVVDGYPEGESEARTTIRVSAEGERGSRAYGDRIRVAGVLERPKAFETDLGRTFSYEEYLRAQGITHVMRAVTVERLEGEGGFLLLRHIFAFKRAFLRSVETLLPEPHAGFASGLLLGEKRALGEELEQVFRDVGIIHIVVLSGYNLTIVAESIMRLLSFVVSPRTRAGIGACSIGVFAVMVGLSATVVRASVMALLVLLARATGRTYVALRALALAGMGMLFFNPYVLSFDPGFQLSFLATLGLMFVSPLVDAVLQWVPTRLQIREYVTSTVATQIFVTPLLLYSIGSVSLVALVANVLVLVAVPLAMLATFIAGMLGIFLGSTALLFALPAYGLLSYMLFVADVLARTPFASFTVPSFPFIYVLIAYVLLIALLALLWHKRKLGGPEGPPSFTLSPTPKPKL